MRLLLVEDERNLSASLKKGLIEANYAVDQAFDGEDGLHLASTETYDCIILDIMLPKLDGITLCRKLRGSGVATPILMLTAKDTEEDITTGLDSGADDYLAKPFSFAELKSRVQALIRRSYHDISPVLKLDDLQLDPSKHEVIRNDRPIDLTPREYAILELLLRHKDEVVTRTMIIEHVWDINYEGLSNVVDVFIASLRKKIDRSAKTKLIHTVHGIGFKVSAKNES